MGLDERHVRGQTPLSALDISGLLVPTVTTLAELNEFEQHNNVNARLWLEGKIFTYKELLTRSFILQLHKKMFGDVWDWVGKLKPVWAYF